MSNTDPGLRRVIAEVRQEDLSSLLGVLGGFATEHDIQFSVADADPAQSEPSVSVEPAFALPSINPNMSARDKTLLEQVMLTYPRNADGYLGKEHFWVLGQAVGLEKKPLGQLFTEVCFPIDRLQTREEDRKTIVQKVDPAELGLVITDRLHADMPPCPVPLSTWGENLAVAAHIGSDQQKQIIHAISSTVVQIRGLKELSSQEKHDNVLGPLPQHTLRRFMSALVQFT